MSAPLNARNAPAEHPKSFSGAETRGLRRAKGLTLAALAEISETSVGYLSQIESDLVVPSIKSLRRISDALGVTVGFFFPPQGPVDAREQEIVVRAAGRRELNLGDGITNILLSPNLNGQLEILPAASPHAPAVATLGNWS